jgi:hypothetical protein
MRTAVGVIYPSVGRHLKMEISLALKRRQVMRRVNYLVPVLALTLALAGVAPVLHGQDSRAEIQKRIAAEYKRTKMTADRSDIATAGSVLDLHKDGLVMASTEAVAPPTNTYKNGAISFGFGANMAWGMALAPANQQTTAIALRKFVTGEKFWVTDYMVKPDGVVFVFYSDPYNDVRYYGQLKFPFAKNVPPPANDVMKEIEEVITAEADSQEAAPADNAAPAAQAPAQPSAPPKTIALGQTPDQVVGILGQPQKIVNLGAKQIYFYPDMKVIFTNGKVTDVQ